MGNPQSRLMAIGTVLRNPPRDAHPLCLIFKFPTSPPSQPHFPESALLCCQTPSLRPWSGLSVFYFFPFALPYLFLFAPLVPAQPESPICHSGSITRCLAASTPFSACAHQCCRREASLRFPCLFQGPSEKEYWSCIVKLRWAFIFILVSQVQPGLGSSAS